MISLNDTKCCGLREIDNLSSAKDTKEALNELKKYLLNPPHHEFASRAPAYTPFILYTGVTGRVRPDHASFLNMTSNDINYGQDFTDYVVKQGLGKVTSSSERINTITGNSLTVWIWEPDYQALFKWWSENGPKVEVNELVEKDEIPF